VNRLQTDIIVRPVESLRHCFGPEDFEFGVAGAVDHDSGSKERPTSSRRGWFGFSIQSHYVCRLF
jgi:hypothetical protein